MGQSTRNVVGLTNSNTMEIWHGAARLTPKLTLLDWKPNQENHAHILSNMSTIRMSTW